MHCMIFQMFSDSPQKNLKNNLLPDGLIIIYSCMNCVSFPVSIYLLVFTFYSINSYLMQKLLDIMLFSWEHLVTYIHLSSVWQTLRHIYVHLALRSASAVELVQAPPACSSSPNAPLPLEQPSLLWPEQPPLGWNRQSYFRIRTHPCRELCRTLPHENTSSSQVLLLHLHCPSLLIINHINPMI